MKVETLVLKAATCEVDFRVQAVKQSNAVNNIRKLHLF